MKKINSKNKKMKREKMKRKIIFIGTIIMCFSIIIHVGLYVKGLFIKKGNLKLPDELIIEYMNYIQNKEYQKMYEMINVEISRISEEDFIKRNSAIYEGIEVQNILLEVIEYDKEQNIVTYNTSFDTVAGKVSFENEAFFKKGEEGYELVWKDSLIFPDLSSTDKVRISNVQARRGEILDRNGEILAGWGIATSVGIVPGKLENREENIKNVAELLNVSIESIEEKLSAKWVKEDSFVPIQTLPKIEGIELMTLNPDTEVLIEYERQIKLLEISGVMMSDIEVRSYPLKEGAAHLVGYVQSVTAEDLEEHADEGYSVGSVIGRNGMEGLFEKELKGKDGCRIYIIDSDGNEKKEIANMMVQHGQNIKLTIDANLQKSIYEQFKDDKGCSVAINPKTGEVLALVSTPSYDNNDFIMGLSNEEWNILNEDDNKPMYNRFRQVWCPGSTFKPIIAAIGLESRVINPTEDYGNEGLSWQKDLSWGSYYITTLHTYEPVVLENALIYSDNIYFAKAALKIGMREMEKSLRNIGFNKDLPFEIKMTQSQYSNTEKIETEIQLADSGYGQGQILINPLHMACIYSAFYNEGNMIKPYLLYQNEVKADYYIQNAFSKEVADMVLQGMIKVVNDRNGTAYSVRMDEVMLAGKTGTAELKESKEDIEGTELGWFAVFNVKKDVNSPIMLISMVEDVKGRGGSGYVAKKDYEVLEKWFENNK